MVKDALMSSFAPLVLIVIAFSIGFWFTFWPVHAMQTLSKQAILFIERFYGDRVRLLSDLHETRRLLAQDQERLGPNLIFIRRSGIVTLAVGVVWSWIFYGS
jgi:hypothetical protein